MLNVEDLDFKKVTFKDFRRALITPFSQEYMYKANFSIKDKYHFEIYTEKSRVSFLLYVSKSEDMNGECQGIGMNITWNDVNKLLDFWR